MKRKKLTTSRELTQAHKEWLFDDLGPYVKGEKERLWGIEDSEGEMRKVWHKHRDELLDEYVTSHRGKRPWAFWKFEILPDRKTLGQASYWNDKKEFVVYDLRETDVQFFERHGLWHNDIERMHCEQWLIADNQTTANLIKGHKTNLEGKKAQSMV